MSQKLVNANDCQDKKLQKNSARKSPSCLAKNFKGHIALGLDGKIWTSVESKKGVWSWKQKNNSHVSIRQSLQEQLKERPELKEQIVDILSRIDGDSKSEEQFHQIEDEVEKEFKESQKMLQNSIPQNEVAKQLKEEIIQFVNMELLTERKEEKEDEKKQGKKWIPDKYILTSNLTQKAHLQKLSKIVKSSFFTRPENDIESVQDVFTKRDLDHCQFIGFDTDEKGQVQKVLNSEEAKERGLATIHKNPLDIVTIVPSTPEDPHCICADIHKLHEYAIEKKQSVSDLLSKTDVPESRRNRLPHNINDRIKYWYSGNKKIQMHHDFNHDIATSEFGLVNDLIEAYYESLYHKASQLEEPKEPSQQNQIHVPTSDAEKVFRDVPKVHRLVKTIAKAGLATLTMAYLYSNGLPPEKQQINNNILSLAPPSQPSFDSFLQQIDSSNQFISHHQYHHRPADFVLTGTILNQYNPLVDDHDNVLPENPSGTLAIAPPPFVNNNPFAVSVDSITQNILKQFTEPLQQAKATLAPIYHASVAAGIVATNVPIIAADVATAAMQTAVKKTWNTLELIANIAGPKIAAYFQQPPSEEKQQVIEWLYEDPVHAAVNASNAVHACFETSNAYINNLQNPDKSSTTSEIIYQNLTLDYLIQENDQHQIGLAQSIFNQTNKIDSKIIDQATMITIGQCTANLTQLYDNEYERVTKHITTVEVQEKQLSGNETQTLEAIDLYAYWKPWLEKEWNQYNRTDCHVSLLARQPFHSSEYSKLFHSLPPSSSDQPKQNNINHFNDTDYIRAIPFVQNDMQNFLYRASQTWVNKTLTPDQLQNVNTLKLQAITHFSTFLSNVTILAALQTPSANFVLTSALQPNNSVHQNQTIIYCAQEITHNLKMRAFQLLYTAQSFGYSWASDFQIRKNLNSNYTVPLVKKMDHLEAEMKSKSKSASSIEQLYSITLPILSSLRNANVSNNNSMCLEDLQLLQQWKFEAPRFRRIVKTCFTQDDPLRNITEIELNNLQCQLDENSFRYKATAYVQDQATRLVQVAPSFLSWFGNSITSLLEPAHGGFDSNDKTDSMVKSDDPTTVLSIQDQPAYFPTLHINAMATLLTIAPMNLLDIEVQRNQSIIEICDLILNEKSNLPVKEIKKQVQIQQKKLEKLRNTTNNKKKVEGQIEYEELLRFTEQYLTSPVKYEEQKLAAQLIRAHELSASEFENLARKLFPAEAWSHSYHLAIGDLTFAFRFDPYAGQTIEKALKYYYENIITQYAKLDDGSACPSFSAERARSIATRLIQLRQYQTDTSLSSQLSQWWNSQAAPVHPGFKINNFSNNWKLQYTNSLIREWIATPHLHKENEKVLEQILAKQEDSLQETVFSETINNSHKDFGVRFQIQGHSSEIYRLRTNDQWKQKLSDSGKFDTNFGILYRIANYGSMGNEYSQKYIDVNFPQTDEYRQKYIKVDFPQTDIAYHYMINFNLNSDAGIEEFKEAGRGFLFRVKVLLEAYFQHSEDERKEVSESLKMFWKNLADRDSSHVGNFIQRAFLDSNYLKEETKDTFELLVKFRKLHG